MTITLQIYCKPDFTHNLLYLSTMPRIHKGHINLLPSGLQGQNIAVMGAGALIVHEMEKR